MNHFFLRIEKSSVRVDVQTEMSRVVLLKKFSHWGAKFISYQGHIIGVALSMKLIWLYILDPLQTHDKRRSEAYFPLQLNTTSRHVCRFIPRDSGANHRILLHGRPEEFISHQQIPQTSSNTFHVQKYSNIWIRLRPSEGRPNKNWSIYQQIFMGSSVECCTGHETHINTHVHRHKSTLSPHKTQCWLLFKVG